MGDRCAWMTLSWCRMSFWTYIVMRDTITSYAWLFYGHQQYMKVYIAIGIYGMPWRKIENYINPYILWWPLHSFILKCKGMGGHINKCCWNLKGSNNLTITHAYHYFIRCSKGKEWTEVSNTTITHAYHYFI